MAPYGLAALGAFLAMAALFSKRMGQSWRAICMACSLIALVGVFLVD